MVLMDLELEEAQAVIAARAQRAEASRPLAMDPDEHWDRGNAAGWVAALVWIDGITTEQLNGCARYEIPTRLMMVQSAVRDKLKEIQDGTPGTGAAEPDSGPAAERSGPAGGAGSGT